MKQIIKKELKFMGRKALGASICAVVFILVAGTGIWALAAFTEPTDTPGNSVQDWAKNIMGANNSDNAFDSSDVTANGDGSMIERIEHLEAKTRATALSAEAVSTMTYVEASIYCRNLSTTAETTLDGSSTSTTYTDWRLGLMTELSNFVGTTASGNYTWTATPKDSNSSYWMILRLSEGVWYGVNYNTSYNVRCVR